MNTIIQPIIITFTLLALAIVPTAQAALNPPPDGGYPGGNTAEGDVALSALTSGRNNTAIGNAALWFNNTGSDNTATGYFALSTNDHGNGNTANGSSALEDSFGSYNTATGGYSLARNFSGWYNTANGYAALYSNHTGTGNTASGLNALFYNTEGNYNTANGFVALAYNVTGTYNTATGGYALYKNITGTYNTANGYGALFANTEGSDNTATGLDALFNNTDGRDNTANGYLALANNTRGGLNTAIGYGALHGNIMGFANTAVGADALYIVTGSSNVGLGILAGSALTTGSGDVCIGDGVLGAAGESNTTRIRNIYSSVATGRAVYVNSDNKLGTLSSSRRYKEDITPMDTVSKALFSLKPVKFRYKKEIDASGVAQFGLIAEEVANINRDLVTRDLEGKPETVRYDAVNAMLLNEFLKEHRKVVKLETTVAREQKSMKALTAQLKEQAALIQKIAAQIEIDKRTPKVVVNQP